MRITTKPDGKKVIAINARIDLDAYELLVAYSPLPRGHGRFLSRLLYEFQARQEEKKLLRRRLEEAVLGAGDVA
jgi:hypothetical protein